MDFKLLEIVAGTAGVAGVAIGALILIYKQILAEKLFPQLTKAHAFRILLFMVFASWTVALAGIAAYAYSAQIDPKPRPLAVGYLGCFGDNGDVVGLKDRALDGYGPHIDDVNMTGGKCIQLCRSRDFKFAAVQFRSQCYCGNAYDKYGKSNRCDMPCPGNAHEICGGFWANTVYKTSSLRTAQLL